MLVATAVTLVLVLAVTRSFAVVSEIISVNRASLEMSGQLRSATLRLQEDLDGVTAPVQPWLDSAAGLGYFEYVEGLGTDAAPIMHTTGVAAPAAAILPTNSYLGDVDDVIMFTARSLAEPFVGNLWRQLANGTTISETIGSKTAEVAWWTVLQDTNRNEFWDPGETFTLHRRVLLIRPDLNDPVTGMLPAATNALYPPTPHGLNLFYNNNDVSVRPLVGTGGVILGFAANSLGDLTLRQNRFAHYPVSNTNPPNFLRFGLPNRPGMFDPRAFPFELDLRPSSPTSLLNLVQWGVNRGPDNGWGSVGNDDDSDGITDNASEALAAGSDDLLQNQIGHDIILPNVLAFDVRAFDVTAPVDVHRGLDGQWGVATLDDDGDGQPDDVDERGWPGSDDEGLTPGDPGWVVQPFAGRGAYVDLNYTRLDVWMANPLSQFSNPPPYLDRNANGSRDDPPLPGVRESFGITRPTYDTWPLDYERNGFDEDRDGLIDEGLNGIDNAGFAGVVDRGVDDYFERETRPPYDVPLRGIQVRIRLIDPGTRQVRQQSVRSDFTAE